MKCNRARIQSWCIFLSGALSFLGIPMPSSHALSVPVRLVSTAKQPLARMLQEQDWGAAQAYVDQQGIKIIPEIRSIISDPELDPSTQLTAYGYLRPFHTLESTVLLAYGPIMEGRSNTVLGLLEDPRPEVYPILKARLDFPLSYPKNDLLLIMAQMPVPVGQRIADIRPYLGTKYIDTRYGAVFGLALLDFPGSNERFAYELGTKLPAAKAKFLSTFHQYSAWCIPKFMSVLIPVLNDSMPLKDIVVSHYREEGRNSYLVSQELHHVRAWDYALNILVNTLKIDVPFKVEDDVTYSKAQRDLVKQKLRDLGYTVTDEPYPVTAAE